MNIGYIRRNQRSGPKSVEGPIESCDVPCLVEFQAEPSAFLFVTRYMTHCCVCIAVTSLRKCRKKKKIRTISLRETVTAKYGWTSKCKTCCLTGLLVTYKLVPQRWKWTPLVSREENSFMLETFCIWPNFESKSVWTSEMVYLSRNIPTIYDWIIHRFVGKLLKNLPWT